MKTKSKSILVAEDALEKNKHIQKRPPYGERLVVLRSYLLVAMLDFALNNWRKIGVFGVNFQF